MANLALRDKQLEHADALYRQALEVLRQVGSVRGVANCLLDMGYLAHERGDTETAQRAFEQALENYQRVGDKAHERECHQQLGRG